MAEPWRGVKPTRGFFSKELRSQVQELLYTRFSAYQNHAALFRWDLQKSLLALNLPRTIRHVADAAEGDAFDGNSRVDTAKGGP